MRKIIKTIGLLSLVVAVLLTACGGFSYTMTSTNDKTTVKINNADDGDSIDSDSIIVDGDKVAIVDSALEKGQIQVELIEATVFPKEDSSEEDVIEGDVATAVTVGPGEQQELEAKAGEYILRFTAVGEASGKVEVRFENQ